jgi:hypothetical protein
MQPKKNASAFGYKQRRHAQDTTAAIEIWQSGAVF